MKSLESQSTRTRSDRRKKAAGPRGKGEGRARRASDLCPAVPRQTLLQGPRRLTQCASQAQQKKTLRGRQKKNQRDFPPRFPSPLSYSQNSLPEKRNPYLLCSYIPTPIPTLPIPTLPFSTFLQTINMLQSVSFDRITRDEGLLTRLKARKVFCVAPEWPHAVMKYEVMKRERLACFGPVWEH